MRLLPSEAANTWFEAIFWLDGRCTLSAKVPINAGSIVKPGSTTLHCSSGAFLRPVSDAAFTSLNPTTRLVMIFRCPIRLLYCFAVLVLCAQFASPAVAQFEKRLYHPRPESIPDATDPSLVIDLSDLEEWDELPPFIDTTGFRTVVFGREDGEDYELLSHVADVATDGKGAIFILDAWPGTDAASDAKTVHVIDTEANYLGNFGRTGDGPGEFMYPRFLMVADEGNTVLVAGSDRRVVVFKRTESGTFEFDKNLRTSTGASAACLMRGHFYVVRYQQSSGHVIHKYTMDGDYVTGFGTPYEYDNPGVVRYMSNGARLSCIEDHGVVAISHYSIPVIRAYNEEGDQLWVVRVEGIRTGKEITESGSSTTFHGRAGSEKGYGFLRISEAFGDGWLYLSAQKELGDDRRRVLTFRIDPETGAYTHVGSGGVLTITEDDLLVFGGLVENEDGFRTPQVVIRSKKEDQ